MHRITAKKKAFCEAFLSLNSYSDAYKQVYSCSASSRLTINKRSSELASEPLVQAYIEELQTEARSAAVMDRREALETLTSIGRGRLPEYLNEDGSINLKKVAESGGAEVESLTVKPTKDGQTITLKLSSPVAAIERIAKLEGWDTQGDAQPVSFVFNIPQAAPVAGTG